MKVRIMDYETAKAKVLAREQNPCYANDKTVCGVDKTWEGWGQVRDVYKNLDYFHDVEDGFELPNYLIADATPEDVLRYGEIIVNEQVVLNGDCHIYICIISYNGSIYYCRMVDDRIVKCEEIGLAMK